MRRSVGTEADDVVYAEGFVEAADTETELLWSEHEEEAEVVHRVVEDTDSVMMFPRLGRPCTDIEIQGQYRVVDGSFCCPLKQ